MTYRGFRNPASEGQWGGVKRDHLQTYERSIASSKETPKNDKDGTGLWFSKTHWHLSGSSLGPWHSCSWRCLVLLFWVLSEGHDRSGCPTNSSHNLGKLANLLPVSYWLDSCIASNKLIALYRWELPLKASLSHILKMFQILLQVALFKVGK